MTTDKDFIVLAHRGSGRPENTIPAFDRAFRRGADGNEFDVRFLKDSDDLAVMHDRTVNRTTNGHGPVRGYVPESFTRLLAGDDVHVPLLSGVFQRYRYRYRDGKAIYNVELKEKASFSKYSHLCCSTTWWNVRLCRHFTAKRII